MAFPFGTFAACQTPSDTTCRLAGIVWQLGYAKTFLASCHHAFNLGVYSSTEEMALVVACRFELLSTHSCRNEVCSVCGALTFEGDSLSLATSGWATGPCC